MENSVFMILLKFLTSFVAVRVNKLWLQMFIVMNMIFIPVMGPKLFDFFGMVSNVGNIFYAFVIFGYAAIINLYGRSSAFNTLWVVFYSMALLFLNTIFLRNLQPVVGNETIVALQNELLEFSERIIAASFAAQVPTLAVLTGIMCHAALKNKPVIAYTLGFIFAQIIDSIIFFWIAFGRLDIGVDGLIIKLIIGFSTIPLFWLMVKTKKAAEIN